MSHARGARVEMNRGTTSARLRDAHMLPEHRRVRIDPQQMRRARVDSNLIEEDAREALALDEQGEQLDQQLHLWVVVVVVVVVVMVVVWWGRGEG